MASKRTRGSAASKLLKDMPDDEQMPPEDAGAPSDAPPVAEDPSGPPPAAAGPVEGLAEGAEGLPPGGPEEAPPPPDDGGGAVDLDSALAGVEAALQGMPEDAAREIRTHLEAIKDIASQTQGAMQPSGSDSEPPQDIPSPDSGMPGAAPGMEEKV